MELKQFSTQFNSGGECLIIKCYMKYTVTIPNVSTLKSFSYRL